jgi:hypothetical protein
MLFLRDAMEEFWLCLIVGGCVMKNLIVGFVLLSIVGAAGCMSVQDSATQSGSANMQLFYDQLSPYGSWVNHQTYGYVWIPNAGAGFKPYATSGRWVFTERGWTWDSDLPWGWAAFHYGRWDHDETHGWMWLPDGIWGPAWVSWRSAPAYYGWTPLRPGMSARNATSGEYYERDDRWVFVHDRDILSPEMGRRFVDPSQNSLIVARSRVIMNMRKERSSHTTFVSGPALGDVELVIRASVVPTVVAQSDKPVRRLGNGELQVYRPILGRVPKNGPVPAPNHVATAPDVSPVVAQPKPVGGDRTKAQVPQRDAKRQ